MRELGSKTMAQNFAKQWFENYFSDFDAVQEELGELDRQLGDGDFAVNLSSALGLGKKGLEPLSDDASAEEVFHAVSQGFLNTGGTSGPLLGMWFRDIAKAFGAENGDVSALASGVRAGTSTIQRLGGARAGDKTMVDAMLPAADALEKAASDGSDLATALQAAVAGAEEGADSTADIKASLGRASYVGDVAVGLPDPGAKAIALFFESGLKAAQ